MAAAFNTRFANGGAWPHHNMHLHAGLANGLLGPDQPWRVTDIEPFATPTTCVLRLQHLAAAEPSAASDHVA